MSALAQFVLMFLLERSNDSCEAREVLHEFLVELARTQHLSRCRTVLQHHLTLFPARRFQKGAPYMSDREWLFLAAHFAQCSMWVGECTLVVEILMYMQHLSDGYACIY